MACTYIYVYRYMYSYIHIYIYVYIYIYIYVYIHVYMYYMNLYIRYIYIYSHFYIYIYIFIHTYTFTHICRYIHIFIFEYMHVCIHMHVYIYTYIYPYMYIYIYTYTRIYIHICIYTHIYTYTYRLHRLSQLTKEQKKQNLLRVPDKAIMEILCIIENLCWNLQFHGDFTHHWEFVLKSPISWRFYASAQILVWKCGVSPNGNLMHQHKFYASAQILKPHSNAQWRTAQSTAHAHRADFWEICKKGFMVIFTASSTTFQFLVMGQLQVNSFFSPLFSPKSFPYFASTTLQCLVMG